MAQHNRAHTDESDDERNAVNARIPAEEEDEFSTYFTDQKVDIPENDKVFFIVNHRCVIVCDRMTSWAQLMKVMDLRCNQQMPCKFNRSYDNLFSAWLQLPKVTGLYGTWFPDVNCISGSRKYWKRSSAGIYCKISFAMGAFVGNYFGSDYATFGYENRWVNPNNKWLKKKQ